MGCSEPGRGAVRWVIARYVKRMVWAMDVIAGIQTQVDDNRRETRAGTALALATSGLHFDPRPGKASLAAAFGSRLCSVSPGIVLTSRTQGRPS